LRLCSVNLETTLLKEKNEGKGLYTFLRLTKLVKHFLDIYPLL